MDFEKYVNRVPYPNKRDFTTIYYYADGELQHLETPLTGNITKAGKVPPGSCVKERSLDVEAYKQAMSEYQRGEAEAQELFWKDLFEELGIPEDHPKAKTFKDIAWAYGHSSGLHDVYSYACDIAELIQD